MTDREKIAEIKERHEVTRLTLLSQQIPVNATEALSIAVECHTDRAYLLTALERAEAQVKKRDTP